MVMGYGFPATDFGSFNVLQHVKQAFTCLTIIIFINLFTINDVKMATEI